MSVTSVYSHKALHSIARPALPPAHRSNSTRLNDYLDAIREEFASVASEMDLLRTQRDDYELKISSQCKELDIIRRSLCELELQTSKVRVQYEDEIRRLRTECTTLRQAANPPSGIPGFCPPPGPPKPSDVVSPASTDESTPGSSRNPRERTTDASDPEQGRDNERPSDDRDPIRLKAWKVRDDFDRGSHSAASSSPRIPSIHSLYPLSGVAAPNGALLPGEDHTLPPLNLAKKSFNNDLAVQKIPPEYRKEGSDWFALFNPGVKRTLDVNLMHTLVHESVVCCVQFSSDGRYIATGCNHTAQIYDSKTGAKICVLVDDSASKSGDLYIRSVRFSPDDKLLATGAEDRKIRIWDIAKRRIRMIFEGHQQEIYSLDFSRDGNYVASGSGDHTTRIWNLNDQTCKIFTVTDSSSSPESPGSNHIGNADPGVTSVSISPDGRLVAAGGLDSFVRVWDIMSGKLLESLRGHRDSVYSVTFTPDGREIISGSLDRAVKVWDISELVKSLRNDEDNSSGGGGGGSARSPSSSPGIVNVKREKSKVSACTKNLIGHKDYVLAVAVSRDSQWVVSGSKDRCVRFWDPRAGEWQFTLQGHKNSVISLDLNLHGNMFATGSGDSLARVWSYSKDV